jgi:hypothetical protein
MIATVEIKQEAIECSQFVKKAKTIGTVMSTSNGKQVFSSSILYRVSSEFSPRTPTVYSLTNPSQMGLSPVSWATTSMQPTRNQGTI